MKMPLYQGHFLWGRKVRALIKMVRRHPQVWGG